jgi:hypothetical protein
LEADGLDGLPHLVASVSSDVRAMLALFCYRRSHLHALAISIASSCSERELIEFGGRVDSTLYALSHDTAVARPSVSAYHNARSSHCRPSRSRRWRRWMMISTTRWTRNSLTPRRS